MRTRLLPITALCLGAIALCRAVPASAQDLTAARVAVTGEWHDASLLAWRVEERDPRRDPDGGEVVGALTAVHREQRTCTVGALVVRWTAETVWRGLNEEDLQPGWVVEVVGRFVPHNDRLPAHLLAERIERADEDPARVELVGSVSASSPHVDGGVTLTVLGVPVRVRPATLRRQAGLTERPDDYRPDEQVTVEVFGRPLVVGGEVGLTLLTEEDFSLGAARHDDVFRTEGEIELELLYPLTDDLTLFLEGKAFSDTWVALEEDDEEDETGVERGETWVFASHLFASPFSVQVGRQNMVEPRQWWWDEDLDAARVHYDRPYFHAELAVAQELAAVSSHEDLDPEQEDVRRVLGRAAWRWAPDHEVDAFLVWQHDSSSTEPVGRILDEDDRDENDADLVWLGLRAQGTAALPRRGEVDYWVDGAVVTGHETAITFREVGEDYLRVVRRRRRDVSGWALDLGVTLATDLPLEPAFTLAYAVGSGDDSPHRGDHTAFRQTSLSENEGAFRGVDQFQYYGELLQPELSNLQVLTAAVGVSLLESSSIEFLYHYYRQVHAVNALRDSALDVEPLGRSADIGHEWDLVVGIEEWEHWEVEFVAALYRSGGAFGPLARETALLTTFKINYNF